MLGSDLITFAARENQLINEVERWSIKQVTAVNFG